MSPAGPKLELATGRWPEEGNKLEFLHAWWRGVPAVASVVARVADRRPLRGALYPLVEG